MERSIQLVERWADRFHVDICDGHFAPALTYGPDMVRAMAEITAKPLHIHLGVSHPAAWIELFADAGAGLMSFHLQTTDRPADLIDAIRARACKAGLVLEPLEDVRSVSEYVDRIDVVVAMTVNPGFPGQTPSVDPVARASEVSRMLEDRGSNACLELDGGVKAHLVGPLIRAGADALVIGSAIFEQGGAQREAARFRELIDGAPRAARP
ncbi:MAG: ribulose-phosphate 3-epimerase [Actinomycetota bacterium]|nr:ribulose-phosphate 3-epimerase [Actinomycetota bacterium]